MSDNSRQQRLLERLEEDERLRGDLAGEAAQQLLDWARTKVLALTNDPSRPDSEVEAQVQAVRSAARQAARAGTQEAQQVVALAEAAYAATMPSKTFSTANIIQPYEHETERPSRLQRTWRNWRDRAKRWFRS